MSNQHTPGPWLSGTWTGREIFNQDGHFIATTMESGILSVPENIANARLIAAAPTMLAALQSVARLLDDPDADDFDADKVQAEAEAAIKLATGVQL